MSFRFAGALVLMMLLLSVLSSCGDAAKEPTLAEKNAHLQVAMVLDTGNEDDKSFNSHALKGAKSAAAKYGFELTYTSSHSEMDYESHLENVAAKKPGLIISVGFRMGAATASAARRHPNLRFAVIDVAFHPGAGCPENVSDCYSPEGGLTNVTSLLFAEDEVAYLAGVLAASMSKTGKIASVAGPDILPVHRFVAGYASGAKSVNQKIEVQNIYLPGFNDPELGRMKATDFIENGADVVFAVGGSSGCGALLAAKDAKVMAIGVDGDQYFTVPEAKEALLSSASKHIDIATEKLIDDFVAGTLKPGIRLATLENGGVGLSPFHDWEEQISAEVRARIEKARLEVIANPKITGATAIEGEAQ